MKIFFSKYANVLVVLSALWFIVYIFFPDVIEDNYFRLKYGRDLPGNGQIMLNTDLFVITQKNADDVTLKLRGDSFKDLKVELSLMDKSLRSNYELLEQDNVILNIESCFALNMYVDMSKKYIFLIQHEKSGYTFLFDRVLDKDLTEKICNEALIYI